MKANSGTITLSDVAAAAGVSLATASRVLNGSTRVVAEQYRNRVEAAATELGYTANLSAQAIAKGTSAVVALLVADIADPYFGELAAGVASGADEAGLIVTIATTNRDDERELRLVRALRGQRPRGVILAASRTSPDLSPELAKELNLITSTGGHIVALGTNTQGIRGLSIDNHGGAKALGLTLAQAGYREAIILGADTGIVTSDDRIAGFTTGFTQGSGEIIRIQRGAFTREAGFEQMAKVLADGVRPGTVVFGISDVVAIGAMGAIRAAGREIGSDIALCGFDDIPTSRDITPDLTTVRVPLHDIGYQALHAAIDENWSPPALSLEVILRESTPTRVLR